MHLRRRKGKNKSHPKRQVNNGTTREKNDGADTAIKVAQVVSRRRRSLWRRITENPNFGYQLAVILLSLGSENVKMDRRIDAMTTHMAQVKGMTEAVTNAMQALRTVTDLPRNVKRIMDPRA